MCCFVSKSRAHAMLADRITALLPVMATVCIIYSVRPYMVVFRRSEFIKGCYSVFLYCVDGSARAGESTYNGEQVCQIEVEGG